MYRSYPDPIFVPTLNHISTDVLAHQLKLKNSQTLFLILSCCIKIFSCYRQFKSELMFFHGSRFPFDWKTIPFGYSTALGVHGIYVTIVTIFVVCFSSLLLGSFIMLNTTMEHLKSEIKTLPEMIKIESKPIEITKKCCDIVLTHINVTELSFKLILINCFQL